MRFTTIAVTLCCVTPAFAQGSMPEQPPARSTTGSGTVAYTSAMNCDELMQKANAMSIAAGGAVMAFVQKEMMAARAARRRNDEAACEMHAARAVKLLM
ncbi:MAG TPA: hypothetical protein VLV55_11400 [Rhizomicrobium sp.]|nr:hypothetical protein [Rhizomicrobium sp.]